MDPNLRIKKQTVIARYGLEGLEAHAYLPNLAMNWGVVSVQVAPITSLALLMPGKNGYSMALKSVDGPWERSRQRFSFAHELAHLLLRNCGLSSAVESAPDHTLPNRYNDEEILCDQIAAEILMPRLCFVEDAWMGGWGLENLRNLAFKYQTSVPATARRMIDLGPEVCIAAAWKPGGSDKRIPLFQWLHSAKKQYSLNRKDLSPSGLCLMDAATRVEKVVSGQAAVIDLKRRKFKPDDVPTQALGWGRGNYRKVMFYHYPEG